MEIMQTHKEGMYSGLYPLNTWDSRCLQTVNKFFQNFGDLCFFNSEFSKILLKNTFRSLSLTWVIYRAKNFRNLCFELLSDRNTYRSLRYSPTWLSSNFKCSNFFSKIFFWPIYNYLLSSLLVVMVLFTFFFACTFACVNLSVVK